LKKVQQLVGEQKRPVRFGSYDAREVCQFKFICERNKSELTGLTSNHFASHNCIEVVCTHVYLALGGII